MPDSSYIFAEILNSLPKKTMAIFDLDSTLFNVSYRTQKIIDDFTKDPDFRRQFPAEIELLKEARVDHKDWGLNETLGRTSAPISGPFFRALKEYWQKNFFHNRHLSHDQPYPGAVDYVQTLHNHGVKIQYLTGRDHENMFDGTIASLKAHNFPLTDIKNQLFMKPKKGVVEDEDFKSAQLFHSTKESSHIWFFENEPVILNRVANAHPNLKLVWIDTTHSRRELPPPNVYKIDGRFFRAK